MAKENGDLQKIKELIEIMKAENLLEIEIKHGEDRIFLKRSGPQQAAVAALPFVPPTLAASLEANGAAVLSAAKTPPAAVGQQGEPLEIKSPLVGIFYAATSPESKPFVQLGSPVEPMTVVCVIEAMKVMNEIKAETSGTISEVLVTNGQSVEYGQVLFKVKPN